MRLHPGICDACDRLWQYIKILKIKPCGGKKVHVQYGPDVCVRAHKCICACIRVCEPKYLIIPVMKEDHTKHR